jgi:hypothetical protein
MSGRLAQCKLNCNPSSQNSLLANKQMKPEPCDTQQVEKLENCSEEYVRLDIPA